MEINRNHTQWTPDYFTENKIECLNILKQEEVWSSIPLINYKKSEYLEDMRLVRFRGMIQDMHDPEFYFEKYETSQQESNKTTLRNGKYSDIIHGMDKESFMKDNPNNVIDERRTYVVISVPGLNTWTKTYELEQNKNVEAIEIKEPKCTKRGMEDEEMTEVGSSASNEAITGDKSKKICLTESKSTTESGKCSADLIFNYPIPNSEGKTCIIKVYDDLEILKLNEIVEFVGFLSTSPLLGQIEDEFEREIETQVHHPPASLIPRIHCVSWKKLVHSNPLIDFDKFEGNNEMEESRKELLLVLTSLLLGDDLAAEYLICHLISKVYLRSNGLAFGKFTLNITNIPIQRRPDFVKELYNFLELILPKSHYLEMTIKNINEASFIPKKNYDYNRLNSGLLQLSSSTHLVIDETQLTTGQLNTTGFQNVQALINVIQFQSTGYDFTYYKMDYDCDIPILILSEEKSLLPSDFQLPLQPTDDLIDTFPESVDALKKYLKPELLDRIRKYLTIARYSDYNVTNDAEGVIEEEFVQMRRLMKASVDDLHNLMVLVKLKCLSEGKSEFDKDCWRKVCEMENLRKLRVREIRHN